MIFVKLRCGVARFILCLFINVCGIFQLQAAGVIPDCRYDNSLVPIVKHAVDWAIKDFNKNQTFLPFEKVIYNTQEKQEKNVLTINLVKDATLSTVDDSGCIINRLIKVSSGAILTDGTCVATDRSGCTLFDDIYMKRHFEEIHGRFSNTRTGYGYTGMCYMTNLQACMHKDKLDLLKVVGPRDKLSVRGSCVTDATPPMSIRCSAGALKMLLSRPAAKKGAPTVGILFILSHELGHLSERISSTYDSGDYTIDRSWPREDKFTVIRNQCQKGNSLRAREEAADKLALMVVKQHINEISRRWPKQGSSQWLITQAGHFSTNLVRWNNDWYDKEHSDEPAVFFPEKGITFLTEEDMVHKDKEDVPSGYSPTDIRIRSKMFLCELAKKTNGKWMILLQSGTTHSTMIERVSSVVGSLRNSIGDSGEGFSKLEGMTGKLQDFSMRRKRSYLRELEAEICDLLDQPLNCPGDL